jgi:hypothetical protein
LIAQMAPSQPLADKTNQQAWARLLDYDCLEEVCPRRLHASSHVLDRLIRFYISIEDGECTVERDLGEFRDQILEHRTSDIKFLDGSLFVRINGPRTAAEFDEGIDTPRDGLTPFSRECASLWRELFGSRFGHYNAKATAAAMMKRREAPGMIRRMSLGVLAAARLAVESTRRKAGLARSSGSLVHAGAGAIDSARWSESMTKFQKRSRRNIPGVTQTRASPGGPFMNPAGAQLTSCPGARAQPLARLRLACARVALVGVREDEMCPLTACRILTGPHRCLEAQLVVVPDLSMFHDVDVLAADVDLAVSFHYIASLGLEITTKTQLAAAQGDPRRLSPLQCVRHIPALTQKKNFCVGPRVSIEQEDVRRALERIARADGYKFVVSKT